MHETDYEQGEAVKQWFLRWGNYLIGAIVLAVLAYGGLWFYQDQQQQAREAASDQFQVIIRLTEESAELSEEQMSELASAVDSLAEDHGDTVYSLYAHMLHARYLVADGNYSTAGERLTAALDAAEPDSVLRPVVNYRLARVYYGAGEHDQALTQLDAVAPAGQTVAYDELRGDVHAARGDRAAAREAYGSAWSRAQEQGIQNSILQLKAQNAGAL